MCFSYLLCWRIIFLVRYPPEWIFYDLISLKLQYILRIQMIIKSMQSVNWSLYREGIHSKLSDFFESKTRSRIPLCTWVGLKDAFLFTFSCSIWSKLKSPKSNIIVAFTFDRTFSIGSLNQLRNCELYQVHSKVI